MPDDTFTIGESHFLLHGEPFQILSGEMHYARIPRPYWRDRLRKARAMGLNTVATYVFWNRHEPRPGEFEFSGDNDIAEFVRIAGEEGLWVFLRPGPFVCAEWEFGGYPSWLLEDSSLQVRSTNPEFLAGCRRYLNALGEQLAPLQITRGGPILMVQVENEYHALADEFMQANRDMILDAGFDVPLVMCVMRASDAWNDAPLPGVHSAANGATGQQVFDLIGQPHPHGPFLVAEFYVAWLDTWGVPHHVADLEDKAAKLEWIVNHGISVNLYVFHGGTNFGFWNGAYYEGHFRPDPTSYDYDAPLDEAGRVTPKYHRFREILACRLPFGVSLPPIPDSPPTTELPPISLTQHADFRDLLGPAVVSEHPLTMEDIGQSTGFLLYRTTLSVGNGGTLILHGLRDYAVVLLNGIALGTWDRRLSEDQITLPAIASPATLELLVENGGRLNLGDLQDNRKGILGPVTLSGRELTDWQTFPLPMDNLDSLRFSERAIPSPAFRRGTFTVTTPGDTFLDLRGWGKGVVWVNGQNLGRFWDIGPQQTLYLPAPWLREGENEIHVLVLKETGQTTLAGLAEPILDQLAPA